MFFKKKVEIMLRNNFNICLFAPIPPPFHGANYSVKLFLDSEISKKFSIKHINTQYVDNLENIGKPELSKLFSFLKYLLRIFRTHSKVSLKYIILIPSFSSWPFLRDSITILIIHYFTSIKVILWCHTNDSLSFYNRSNYLIKLYRRFIIRRTSRIVLVGKNLRKNFEPFLGVEKIKIIHNGLPLNINSRIKKTGSVEVIFLSSMMKAKGWLNLLVAAKSICQKHDNIIFKFYGPSSFDSKLEYINESFENSGFSSRILYKGSVMGEAKIDVFMNADIFCLPSYSEAFPFSILEAMMYGLPVIATNTGSINEAIIEGKGGYLLDSNDPENIVKAIEKFINEPEKIREMGNFNKIRFAENFEISIFEKNWIEFLSQLKT